MEASHYKKLKPSAKGFARDKIGSYDPKHGFNQAAFDACAFEFFRGLETVSVLDAMAGPGKFGKEVILGQFEEKRGKEPGNYPKKINLFFNDIQKEPLIELKAEGFGTVHCDVRKLQDQTPRMMFDRVVVRYGLNDLPGPDQIKAGLMAIKGTLNAERTRKGRLVIADMVAYTAEGQAGVMTVRAKKQELAGRDEEKEGRCYVPIEEEWIRLLDNTGFMLKTLFGRVSAGFTSDVDTRNWAGQFGPGANNEEMIATMNETILAVCKENPGFEKEFQIRRTIEKKKEIVTLKFPIIVLAADIWG